MSKKPEAPAVKKPSETKVAVAKPPEAEKTPKVHTSKPSSNPFTQANPGRPGRSANGGTPGSRRGK